MQDNTEQTSQQPTGLRHELREWGKTLVGAFIVYLAFTTVAFANYSIPSESMVPHLEVGDRVVVSKFAYGYSRYSLPFDLGRFLPASTHRLLESYPRRGDVVVFVHPLSGETLIKRAIGLPGDVVEMRDGFLYLNGQRVPTGEPETLMRHAYQAGREFAQRYEETLPDGYAHAVHNLTNDSPYDNFGPYTVPAGHVFFMGDNRDNSLDSRSIEGPAPIENLIGRAEVVYWVNPFGCSDHTVACPMPRWLKPLHH